MTNKCPILAGPKTHQTLPRQSCNHHLQLKFPSLPTYALKNVEPIYPEHVTIRQFAAQAQAEDGLSSVWITASTTSLSKHPLSLSLPHPVGLPLPPTAAPCSRPLFPPPSHSHLSALLCSALRYRSIRPVSKRPHSSQPSPPFEQDHTNPPTHHGRRRHDFRRYQHIHLQTPTPQLTSISRV